MAVRYLTTATRARQVGNTSGKYLLENI